MKERAELAKKWCELLKNQAVNDLWSIVGIIYEKVKANTLVSIISDADLYEYR